MRDWAKVMNFKRKLETENLALDEAEKKLAPVFWIISALAILVICFCPDAKAADASLLVDIIECESSGRHDAVGDDGISVGIGQFQKTTFNEMKKKAHMPHLRWKNPVHQLRLMVWMIDHGYGNRWTCYRKHKNFPPMDSKKKPK